MRAIATALAALAASLFSSAPASAGAGDLRGVTVVAVVETYQPLNGMTSVNERRYYFTKDGRHALWDWGDGSYGRGMGVVFTLEDHTCDLLEYVFEYEGRTVTGRKHVCGQMYREGNLLSLVNDFRDDNGLGHVAEGGGTLIFELLDSGDCRVTGISVFSNAYGTAEMFDSGYCTVMPGRDPSMFE